MADPTKVIKGGLSAIRSASRAADQALEAKRLALEAATPQIKASEAYGQHEGAYMKPIFYDRMKVDLSEGKKGGPGFSGIQLVDPNYAQAKAAAGVTDQKMATRILNRNEAGVPKGAKVIWTPSVGGLEQHKSNSTLFGKFADIFANQRKNMSADEIQKLSDYASTKVDNKGKLIFPNGIDLGSNRFRQKVTTYNQRGLLADIFAGRGVGGEKGRTVPVEELLEKNLDPNVAGAGTLDLGNRLFRLDGSVIDRPDLHSDYRKILTGEDLGVNYAPVPIKDVYTDWEVQKKLELLAQGKDRDVTQMDYTKNDPTVQLTEALLTKMQKAGQKKGGVVRSEESPEDMARFQKRFAMHKAIGGKVKKMAGGGRVSIFDAPAKRMASGGKASIFDKPVHMIDGGKVAKGVMGAVNKASRMADEKIAEQAIGKAAESAGMKAPVTANKPLTNLQDFHTSLGDRIRQGAVETQNMIESMPFKYDKGQRVFTDDSAKKNRAPYEILMRTRYGNQVMREDHPTLGPNMGQTIRDPETGKAQRTPYEPGYRVRGEIGEMILPESAIKGSVEKAKGGRVEESPADMARFQKRFAMHKAIGGGVKKMANGGRASIFDAPAKRFDGGGIASPEESSGPPPDREQTKAGLMAEFLAKMAKDQGKEELSSLKKPRALTDLLNRGVLANNPVSATVDMFNAALMPLDVLGSKLTGRDIKVSSDKPFLGSEYVKDLMNQYGVTSGEERPMMETALSFASPAAMIKGAMKATDAAKKAPELMKKASDAFTSSKMSPLATEAKTASAGKPIGATYATKQEGPFFRVSPTTLDVSGAKNRGIREAPELQGQGVNLGTTGQTGREVPQLLSSEEVGRIIADPIANEPLNIAKKYTQETQGVDFEMPNIPESSLAKQSAIGRAQQLAVDGSPEYKTAVFDAYAKQMPDLLEQSGAKNYDDLMEKAYRQLAKETDDQFKILPYNFSYHRAGEGNYNGAMDMASDVHGNKHLYVYQGGDKHDFLNRIDPASGLNENEKFRAVHDLLGHAIYGNQFGPKGEEMAWAVNSQMYSPLARLAMTAETRGQNSMVNYSPLNVKVKSAIAGLDELEMQALRKGDKALVNEIRAAKRQTYAGFEFAPNKAVLLPPEFVSPKFTGGMPDYLSVANRPIKGTETQSALTHFSNNPNLQMLDPKRYGTGIKGAEAERLRDYAGGVKDRSYFYMGEPSTVTPEAGLGVNRYRGEASSLYDITQDPLNFQTLARESNRTPFTAKVNQGVTYPLQDANDIERLVKEYGYEGMANPKATKPMAIMFKETPVRRQARGGLTLMK